MVKRRIGRYRYNSVPACLKTSKTSSLVCHSDGSDFITRLGEVVMTDTGLPPPLAVSSNEPFISECDVLSSFSIATTLS